MQGGSSSPTLLAGWLEGCLPAWSCKRFEVCVSVNNLLTTCISILTIYDHYSSSWKDNYTTEPNRANSTVFYSVVLVKNRAKFLSTHSSYFCNYCECYCRTLDVRARINCKVSHFRTYSTRGLHFTHGQPATSNKKHSSDCTWDEKVRESGEYWRFDESGQAAVCKRREKYSWRECDGCSGIHTIDKGEIERRTWNFLLINHGNISGFCATLKFMMHIELLFLLCPAVVARPSPLPGVKLRVITVV